MATLLKESTLKKIYNIVTLFLAVKFKFYTEPTKNCSTTSNKAFACHLGLGKHKHIFYTPGNDHQVCLIRICV